MAFGEREQPQRDSQTEETSSEVEASSLSEHRARLAALARRRNEAVHAYDATAADLEALAAEAYHAGLSITEIAQTLGVSRPTVYSFLDRAERAGVSRPRSAHVRGGTSAVSQWRFEIHPTSGGFIWRLVAANGQIIAYSETFSTASYARRAADAVRRHAPSADIYELSGPHRAVRSAPTNKRTVSPKEAGGWEVRKPGASRASSQHQTQAEAQSAARRYLARAGGGELITVGRDGRIREQDTVHPGRDTR